MDTTDFMLLWFGCSCLGAALMAILCEQAPVMDWHDEPADRPLKDVPPLAYGGVIQRRAKPAVPPAPKSYIIPVVCTQYYRRHAWYIVGTTDQIIDHLWLKRETVYDGEDGS